MCKLAVLNNRQKIINEFPIPDRKESYTDLNEALEDALFFAFKDINYRTLHKNDLGEKVLKLLPEMNKKRHKGNEKEKHKLSFLEELKELEIDTINIKTGKDEKRKLKEEEINTITNVVNDGLKNQKDFTITTFLIDHLRKVDFTKSFETYFEDSHPSHKEDASFDDWHHNACQKFLGVLALYYKDAAYGKAQKIVNMTFKHLYCMKIQNKLLQEEYFQYCHLTLDSFTLEWFRREVAKKWYNVTHEKEIHISTAKEGEPFPKWSNLSYRDPENLNYDNKDNRCIKNSKFYHYMFFETMSRRCIANKKLYGTCTVFQAEFYIWPEIQTHLALEALFGQPIGQKQSMKLLDQNLKKYKELFKNEPAILSLVEKYETDKVVKDDETEFDAYERAFDTAKTLFCLLPLQEKTCYMHEKIKSITQKCRQLKKIEVSTTITENQNGRT